MDRIFAEAGRAGRTANGGETAGHNAPSSRGPASSKDSSTSLPGGVVLGPDGKPCRTCSSTAAWSALMRSRKDGGGSGSQQTKSSSTVPSAFAFTGAATSSTSPFASTTTPTSPNPAAQCPPDVERLGRHSWTLLHSISAQYPERPSSAQQADMRSFLTLFGRLYPCWVCADDFRSWMAEPGNAPRVEGREPLNRWMCAAHNAVNTKLGKPEFDCSRWRERWVDGWKDGSCD